MIGWNQRHSVLIRYGEWSGEEISSLSYRNLLWEIETGGTEDIKFSLKGE